MGKDKKKRVGTKPLDAPTRKQIEEYRKLDDKLEALDKQIEDDRQRLTDWKEKFDAELGKVNAPLVEKQKAIQDEMQRNQQQYSGAYNVATGKLQQSIAEAIQERDKMSKRHRRLSKVIITGEEEPVKPSDPEEDTAEVVPIKADEKAPAPDDQVDDEDDEESENEDDEDEPTKTLVVKSPQQLLDEVRQAEGG
jgi:hypothetical protein